MMFITILCRLTTSIPTSIAAMEINNVMGDTVLCNPGIGCDPSIVTAAATVSFGSEVECEEC